MSVVVDKIVAIQAEQLLEWKHRPEVLQHLLEQALQRNLDATPPDARPSHIGTADFVWRGQNMDSEALRFLKSK